MFKKFLSYLNFGLGQYTKSTDSGSLYRKPVKWIYLVIGYLHYIFPLIVLFLALSWLVKIPELGWKTLASDHVPGLEKCEAFFRGTGMTILGIVTLVLSFVLLFSIAYMAVKFWKDRGDRYDRIMNAGGQTEFQLLPLTINFIRSKGEWQGLMVALLFAGGGIILYIVGIMMSLLDFSSVSDFVNVSGFFSLLIAFIVFTLLCLIVIPLIGVWLGYCITCFHRFIAELLGMKVSIATNVGKIKTDTNIISKK